MKFEDIINVIGKLKNKHLIVKRVTKDTDLTSFKAYKTYSITIYELYKGKPIEVITSEITDKFIESTKSTIIYRVELDALKTLLEFYGFKNE